MTVLRRLTAIVLFTALFNVPVVAWAQKGTIKLAVQAPLSGGQSALGEHVKIGGQLAVAEASKASKALGYDLVFVPDDDQAKHDVRVPLARTIVADPTALD